MNQKDLNTINNFIYEAYYGDYDSVFLTEVKRTEGDEVANTWINDVLPYMRYGNVTDAHISFMKEHFAKKEDISKDDAWKKVTVLHGYHYANKKNPLRHNVEADNARGLVRHYEETKNPICSMYAQHLPAKKRSVLSELSGKHFGGISSKLYCSEGLPVMLLENVANSLGLFNGSKHKFVTPLYLKEAIKVTLNKKQLNETKLKGLITTVPFDTFHFKTPQIPETSILQQINGKDATEELLRNIDDKHTVECIFKLPCKPPFPPDYCILENENYSTCSGGKFNFSGKGNENLFPVKTACRTHSEDDKKDDRNSRRKRINPPLEGAHAQTGYKGQGATLDRVEIKGDKKTFGLPGMFYVNISRTKHPSHNYIAIDQWPMAIEVRVQRLNPAVIEAENIERVMKIKSAKRIREDEWQPNENRIADDVLTVWRESSRKKRLEVAKIIYDKHPTENPQTIVKVIKKMEGTNEKLVREGPVFLTSTEMEKLKSYLNGRSKAEKIPIVPNKRNDAITNNDLKKDNYLAGIRNGSNLKDNRTPNTNDSVTSTKGENTNNVMESLDSSPAKSGITKSAHSFVSGIQNEYPVNGQHNIATNSGNSAPLKGSINDTKLATKIEFSYKDILTLDVDAIVNPANESLVGSAGLSDKIQKQGGLKLLAALRALNRCKVGQAKTCDGFDLNCKYLINTVGPQAGTKNCNQLLRQAYSNSLEELLKKKCRTIAFPCISVGIFQFDKAKACEIALKAVKDFLQNHINDVDKIIFSIYDKDNIHFYNSKVNDFFPKFSPPKCSANRKKNAPPSPIVVAPKRLDISNDTTGRAHVFDFLSTTESHNMAQIFRDLEFEVKTTFEKTQIGNSCGYIASAISANLALHETNWPDVNVLGCCTSKDKNLVSVGNNYLDNKKGQHAQLLRTSECAKLTKYLYAKNAHKPMTASQEKRFLDVQGYDSFITKVHNYIGKFDKQNKAFCDEFVTFDNKFPLFVTIVNTQKERMPGLHWFVVALELYLKNSNINDDQTAINNNIPQASRGNNHGLIPLINRASDCWINCIFQVLLHTHSWFIDNGLLIEALPLSQENDQHHHNCDTQFDGIIRQYVQQQPTELHLSKHRENDYSIKKMFSIVAKKENLNTRHQQDVVEALDAFLVSSRYFTYFSFYEKTHYTCCKCNKTSSATAQKSFTLRLPVPQNGHLRSIQHAINEHFYEGSPVSGRKCTNDSCSEPRESISKPSMATIPKFLIIQLMLFNQNVNKININCNVDDQVQVPLLNDQNMPTFKAECIVEHVGNSAREGHYFSFIKKQNTWYKINDNTITETEKTYQPYLCVYKRIDE